MYVHIFGPTNYDFKTGNVQIDNEVIISLIQVEKTGGKGGNERWREIDKCSSCLYPSTNELFLLCLIIVDVVL